MEAGVCREREEESGRQRERENLVATFLKKRGATPNTLKIRKEDLIVHLIANKYTTTKQNNHEKKTRKNDKYRAFCVFIFVFSFEMVLFILVLLA